MHLILASFISMILCTSSLIIPERYVGKWETSNGVLQNGLEYLIIDCQDCKTAAVALSVKIGTKDDVIPGTAHLLEHMIFYSSESYPEEGYFGKFVSLRNGDFNAYTSYEMTNFYFSVLNKDLQEAMNIFSKGFFEARITKENVLREILAVNSEHMKNINDDNWRDFRTLQLLVQGDFGKFGTGNEETLHVEGIEKEVKKVYDKFYVAQRMKLVVYANENTEEVEKWVKNMFEMIRNEEYGKNSEFIVEESMQNVCEMNRKLDLFDAEISGKMAIRNRKAEECSFDVYYCLETKEWIKDAHSENFLMYLLNNQGRGGIMDNLQDIQTFSSEILENYRLFTLAHLGFTLKDHFLYQKILIIIKQYAKTISETSYESLLLIFDDYKKSKQLGFNYLEIPHPEEFVSLISKNMHYFDPEHYISGFDIPDEFNYFNFKNIVDQFLSTNPLLSLSCNYFNDDFQLLDHTIKFNSLCSYYNMEYEIFNILVETKEIFFLSLLNSSLDYLDNLSFIDNFDQNIKNLESNDYFEIWYQFNSDFKVPKARISVIFTFEDWDELEVIFEIKLRMIQLYLVYDQAALLSSGFSFEYEISHKGAVIILKGWNQGIYDFFLKIIDLLQTNSEDFIGQSISILIGKYSALLNSQLYQQSFQKFNDFIFNSKNNYEYKLELLRKTQKIESLSFDKTYLKILVYGNIVYSNQIAKNVYNLINKSPSKIKNRLPSLIKTKADIYEDSDINYSLFYWYDFGPFELKTWSQVLVLEVLIYKLILLLLECLELSFNLAMWFLLFQAVNIIEMVCFLLFRAQTLTLNMRTGKLKTYGMISI